MIRSASMLFVMSVSMLTGCATLDPWGEYSRVPATNAHAFKGEMIDDEGASTVTTQPADEFAGRTLSLAQCAAIALEHNPATAASWQAIRAAAAGAGQARAEYLPSVGFTSSARRTDIPSLDAKADQTGTSSISSGTGSAASSGDLASSVAQSVVASVSKSIASRLTQALAGTSGSADSPGPQSRYEATFGARWLLFDGGGREARVQAAVAEVLAAGFQHNTVLQDVALDVQQTYYGLLAVRSFEEVAVETVKQREYQLRLAEVRHRVGLAAGSDVLKAQAEKAAADLDLVRARNAVHVAKGGLVSAMGLRVSVDFNVTDPPEAEYAQELAEVESLLNEAARNRPELKIALAEVQFQRAGVRQAESRYWPSLSFDTDVGWIGRSFAPDLRQWGLGFVLDLPLFTGFERTYQLRGRQAELARAIAERRAVLRGVELEVWTAYWQTTEATEAIEAARQFVASAEESARVAENEYKNGTGSIIELIDAQTARTTARNQLIRARLDWRTAMAQFERAVGRSLNSIEHRESASVESP